MPTKNQPLNEEETREDGYIIEIFSSFQGEGGSVRGSCFGKRQIFIRFAGCDLQCRWCDTPNALNPKYPICRVETVPGTWEFTKYENPVSQEFVIEQVLGLSTRDFHSVALTGGEPTYDEQFFSKIVHKLYDLELPVFLETAGYQPKRIKRVAKLLSYACVDIKDRSAECTKNESREALINKELETITLLTNYSVKVFAKLVVTEETKLEDVRMIADKIRELVVPIVIQPVTPTKKVAAISNQKLFKISETMGEVLPTDLFGLSIQGHKLLSLL
ncbi:MAG: radical SAM protein [Candidatus Heimdallarchaeota archaeon]|nr:radical SAM protein [Candidatus Heimdallarchaeota archaeon]